MAKNLIDGIPNWLLVVAVIGLFLWMNPSILSVAGKGTGTGTSGGTCNLQGGTYSFDVAATDAIQQGTTPSSVSYVLYYGKDANGNYIRIPVTKASGTPVTNLQPQQPFKAIVFAGGYSNTTIEGTSACQAGVDTQQTSIGKNGGLSVVMYNGGAFVTQNGLTTGNLTVGSGQVVQVKADISGNVTKARFGNGQLDYSIVTVQASNPTDWDYSQFKMDGCTQVGIPTFRSGTDNYAFKCSGLVSKTQDFGHDYRVLTVASKSGTDPAAGTTLKVNFFPADVYINTLTNQPADGIEDNAGNQLTVTGSTPAQYVVTIA